MAEPHVGELAELYAVGALDENERAKVETHIATCLVCLRRVGEAEETVLALEAGAQARIPPRLRALRLTRGESTIPLFVRLGAALAAGLVIGMLSMLPAFLRTQETQHALVAMVGSHFEHAPFVAVGAPRSPGAKVIYARDRSWLFVIVDGSQRYDVYARGAAGTLRLGSLQPQGSTSTLFVDHPTGARTIELRDGPTVIERADLR